MGVCRRAENGHGQQELDEADRDPSRGITGNVLVAQLALLGTTTQRGSRRNAIGHRNAANLLPAEAWIQTETRCLHRLE